nr:putative carbohydrate binding domain containing protein [uncultured Mediterranean phage uvMED]BAR39032.1 putative carbohydrate binding domain containing protein [uncultured Mediterranean phage uvMED]
MSEIKVNSIKGVGASAAAITVNNTDGTCTANITNNLSNRNLIINGAMQVAQRGTSATVGDNSYATVDRFKVTQNSLDEDITQAQVDVASGTTPYNLGLTKALKITNGNQTSGAGAADYIEIGHKIEAQDIRNSGWNYLSSSSFITLTFYVKSSVAQVFYGYIRTRDGTGYSYPFSTGSLSEDTWTKVTKTISGNSNLQIDNDNGSGLELYIVPFLGTDATNNSRSLDSWAAHADASHFPDMTSTWYTTNDATLEITGVQLEVGSVATDFEHRSFGQELALCQRYYQTGFIKIYDSNAGVQVISQNFMPEMRAAPTVTGEQFGSQTNAPWGSIEVTTSRACSFYKNGVEICQRWKCSAEL